jgi:solute carrier family 50 protein (sugar transporter)
MMNYVAPSIGATLSSLLYLSPLSGSRRVHKEQDLGEFNLMPYPMMIFNNTAWILYALGLAAPSQYFVIFPNWVGFISGVFVLGWAFPLASYETRKRIMAVFLVIVVAFLPFAYALLLWCTADQRQKIMGDFTLVMTLLFFATPLMNLFGILKNRDASSIYFPLAVMTAVSCTSWAVYGISISNTPVFLPNAISAVIGYLQMLLSCIFPGAKKSVQEVHSDEEEDYLKTDESEQLLAA